MKSPTINAGIKDNVTRYVKDAALMVQSSLKKSVTANTIILYVSIKNLCTGLNAF